MMPAMSVLCSITVSSVMRSIAVFPAEASGRKFHVDGHVMPPVSVGTNEFSVPHDDDEESWHIKLSSHMGLST